MGTPLPPIIIPPGETCSLCFGFTENFPTKTPSEVILTFRNWSEGPRFEEIYREELGAPQRLVQFGLDPCEYDFQSENFRWQWAFGVGFTACIIQLHSFPSYRAFQNFIGANCVSSFDNQLPALGNIITFDGSASLYFGS